MAGTSGKVVLEGGSDDEGASTEAQGRAILDVLGLERRNEVLAAVYIVRADVSLSVRQVSGGERETVGGVFPDVAKRCVPVQGKSCLHHGGCVTLYQAVKRIEMSECLVGRSMQVVSGKHGCSIHSCRKSEAISCTGHSVF